MKICEQAKIAFCKTPSAATPTPPFSDAPDADAASQRTGISASLTGRQRWSQSHFLRVSRVSNLLETLDLNKKEDISTEEVEEVINPFPRDIDKEHLYNVGTGRAAGKETSTFLLKVNDIGNDAREKFLRK